MKISAQKLNEIVALTSMSVKLSGDTTFSPEGLERFVQAILLERKAIRKRGWKKWRVGDILRATRRSSSMNGIFPGEKILITSIDPTGTQAKVKQLRTGRESVIWLDGMQYASGRHLWEFERRTKQGELSGNAKTTKEGKSGTTKNPLAEKAQHQVADSTAPSKDTP